MPPAQFSRQTIRLQFDKDIHFGDDASIVLAKAGGDIIDTITLRVDWPEGMIKNTNPVSSNGVSYNLSTLVQYSTGTAMIDRVELLYKGQLIERHYGETMFIQGDITVPECKQAGLSNLVGTHVTSNLVTYYIQFPFSVKLPLCGLDESPTLRLVLNPSTYFAFGVQYTEPVNMSLYVDYVYVSKAEREYIQKSRLCYPVRSFQRAAFRIPNTLTSFSCDTHFVNMTKELFWILQEDQYTSNIYNYSNDLITLRLILDGDEIITEDFGTPQFLTWITKHTRVSTANYYVYSFELEPESSQENGSLNMTAVTNQRHILQLTPSNVWRTLRIYAHSYNIFCVEKGHGRTVYTQLESGESSYQSDITIPYVTPPPPPAPLYIFNYLYSPLPSFSYYGQSVALNDNGTTAVIGAAGTNQNTGTVVVYRNNGTTWDSGTQLSSALGPNSYFGYSVDVSDDGNSVVVGSPAANGGHGYVSVYTYNGTTWSDVPILSNIADFTYGWSVAINGTGDTVVIGAPRALGFAGYACAFKKVSGLWVHAFEQPLVSTSTSPSAFFGYSVSVSADGNTAVVGAPSGRYAAVYTCTSGVWGSAAVLTTSLPQSVNFGWSVYMAPLAGAVIVGAPNDEYAAVYRYNGVSWESTPAVQLPSEAGAGGQFGSAVSLNDEATVAVVGASVAGYAAAYIYDGVSWSSANEIANQTGVTNSRFGSALSLSHDASNLLIGAYAYNNANGYAALYKKNYNIVPQAVANFIASSPGGTTVHLSWSSSFSAVSYSITSTPATTTQTTSGTSMTFTGLENDTEYYFTITPVSLIANGPTTNSNSVSTLFSANLVYTGTIGTLYLPTGTYNFELAGGSGPIGHFSGQDYPSGAFRSFTFQYTVSSPITIQYAVGQCSQGGVSGAGGTFIYDLTNSQWLFVCGGAGSGGPSFVPNGSNQGSGNGGAVPYMGGGGGGAGVNTDGQTGDYPTTTGGKTMSHGALGGDPNGAFGGGGGGYYQDQYNVWIGGSGGYTGGSNGRYYQDPSYYIYYGDIGTSYRISGAVYVSTTSRNSGPDTNGYINIYPA